MSVPKLRSILKRSCPLLLLIASPALGADWIAGRDLLANEKPDGGSESLNPNFTVPAWSYGTRFALASPALTLFTPAQHVNSAGGNADLEGFTNGSADVFVNVGAAPIVIDVGAGPFQPLAPGEIFTSPSSANEYGVIRWTAPSAGSYKIDAYWQDLDWNGGDGATAHVVLNGTVVFNQVFPNTGGATASMTLSLATGDLVDFATGVNGNFFFDDTRFDATIVPVPEPSVGIALALGLVASSTCRRRPRP